MSENLVCTIPARGGSKRLARKNLRTLEGKPLLAYTIEVALESGLFDEVYVCTEDQEIAETARRYGARVPILVPEEMCGDLVASHIPCQFMVSYQKQRGRNPEAMVCLQPSSPLRSVDDLLAAAARYAEGCFDFVVSITPLDPHEFHWAVIQGEDQYWKMFFGQQFMKERPLLPAVYRPNGSIKIARLSVLASTGHFFGDRLGVVETPPERSIHVATEFDLEICKTILAWNRQGQP